MTGLAHLFEHLMFGGTAEIFLILIHLFNWLEEKTMLLPTNDITNYYLTIPSENIETGFLA